MKKSRFTEEQMAAILREVDRSLVAQGARQRIFSKIALLGVMSSFVGKMVLSEPQ